MSIEERLARLERGARFWKRLALVLVVALAAVLLWGRATNNDWNVRSLSIKDDNGRERFTLGMGAHGEHLSLRMFDRKAHLPVAISVTPQGEGRFGLYDQNGKRRAWLRVAENGNPSLHLFGQEGRSRAVLWEGGLNLFDVEEGRQRLRASLALEAEGTPSLKFFDAKGDVIWQAPR